MTLIQQTIHSEADYWRIRNFLREVFLLNDRFEHSWHVARLDHWRWHFISTCELTPPFEQVTVTWQTQTGEIAAVLHPICHDEVRMHIHPQYRTVELEQEIIAYAERRFSDFTKDTKRIFYLAVHSDDDMRQKILIDRGYQKKPWWGHHWSRDLDEPIPEVSSTPGYIIRSMGDESEHPARSWSSWRAFHSEEPDENYDGDYSWFKNLQSAPLYRRDLDVVAATSQGEIASFCTISYDDYTRSAVTVLVGTAAEHWRSGLGKAVMIEGMHRLKKLGCTRVFSSATEEPADRLYGSVMQNMKVTDSWVKIF
jgi:GNAT superfamily N-acetyltransferase